MLYTTNISLQLVSNTDLSEFITTKCNLPVNISDEECIYSGYYWLIDLFAIHESPMNTKIYSDYLCFKMGLLKESKLTPDYKEWVYNKEVLTTLLYGLYVDGFINQDVYLIHMLN